MRSGASDNDLHLLNEVILEQMPDAVLVIDYQLKLVRANQQASQMFGYQPKELLGMPLRHLDGLMNATMIGNIVQEVKSVGEATFETKGVHKSGTLIPLEIKASFIKLGEQSYLIAFARDISERARAQQVIEKEKAFLDALMDNVPESIFFKDLNCRLIRVSRKLVKDLGYSDPNDLIGKNDIELFGQEFGEKTLKVDQGILDTGEPSIGLVEKRLKADGTFVWSLTTKAPIKDGQGNITGLVGISREINELKEREEELQAKETQLSIASQIAGLGYWEYNVEEHLFTFNDHFYRIFRTSVEEVGSYKMSLGEYIERFFFPEDREMVIAEIEKALQEKNTVEGRGAEYCIRYPNGEIGYISVRYFSTTDEEGRVVKIYGTNQNITERKFAERETEKIKDQLTVATQMVKLGYWEFNAEEGLFTFNDQFYSIFKTTVEEVGGYRLSPIKYAELFLFPEDRELASREIQMAMEDPSPEYYRYLEHRIRYATGEEGYVGVSFFAVKDEKGDMIKTIGVNQDITDKKLAELALKENEISLQRGFEIAAIGPYKYSIKHETYEWTQQALDVIGFQKENIPVSFDEFLRFVHPEDIEKIRNEVKWADEIGVFDLEHRILINGNLKWIRFKSQIEYDNDHNPLNSIGIVQDITERKLAENELVNYRDHLEKLVRQRTVQLEDINKDLEAFAYSISHDLRAPLRHINGFANILKRRLGKSGDSVQNYIDLINDASNRMGTMIDGLLHFSRLGRQEVNKSMINLNELLGEVLQSFKPDLEKRKIKWIIGDLQEIEGDITLLKIVFENLISNAIKYTRDRELAIIEVGKLKGDNVTIFIKDNGVGFDMTYADKLFGVFQRLHREEDFEGTGIGLANVYQIIKKHGGSIRATSEIDKGATFYITF